MTVDDAKEFAVKVCGHVLLLDKADIERSLPTTMTVEAWRCKSLAGKKVSMTLRVHDPRTFWHWAATRWRWNGIYEIHLTWFTNERFPHDEDWVDVKVAKTPMSRPEIIVAGASWKDLY